VEYQILCIQRADVDGLTEDNEVVSLAEIQGHCPSGSFGHTGRARLLLEFSTAVPVPLMEVGKTYRVTIEEIPDE